MIELSVTSPEMERALPLPPLIPPLTVSVDEESTVQVWLAPRMTGEAMTTAPEFHAVLLMRTINIIYGWAHLEKDFT